MQNNKKGVVQVRSGENLSQSQKEFNRLSRRIEKLQKEIAGETAKLERIHKRYHAQIPKQRQHIAQLKAAFCNLLDKASNKYKYSKRQMEAFQDAIVSLFEQAFPDMQPDKEEEALYDKWAETSYKEKIQEEKEDVFHLFSEEMKTNFGIDFDFSEFEETSEGFEEMTSRLEEELEKNANAKQKKKSRQKKTKKQLEQEAQKGYEEKEKQRNIRSIYISLAKMLHPDTTTDPKKKAQKDELMKKVTQAYKENNLHELLQLELEWVALEENYLNKVSENKMKTYISALKDRIRELEDERIILMNHPRYIDIENWVSLPEKEAMAEIKELEEDLNNAIRTMETDHYYLTRKGTLKREFLQFAEGINFVSDLDFLNILGDLPEF